MSIGVIPRDLDYHVYALLCRDDGGPGYVKFGRSSRILKRLSEIRTACPIKARYFAYIKVPNHKASCAVEKALHDQFAHRRIRTEWYSFDFDSIEAKRDFNDGCLEVFSQFRYMTGSWMKISVAEFDKITAQRKATFMRKHGGHLNQMSQKKSACRQRKNEYADYRS